MITGDQIRTARKMLNWPPERLASRARVPIGVVIQAERTSGTALLPANAARAIHQALLDAGVDFAAMHVNARRRSD